MPRLQPWLFRRAKKLSPELAILLPACKDIPSASVEFRWIRDHVEQTCRGNKQRRIFELCRQRGRGVPLQYVLGAQPFGKLDIKCRPGVLVPRSETEAYTCHLVEMLKTGELLGFKAGQQSHALSIVDFCTGTGCIPLLLYASLQHLSARLRVTGVDISPVALELARDNIAYNIDAEFMIAPSKDQSIAIQKGDVFNDIDIQKLASSPWDLMVSNPPYVSQDVWDHGRGEMSHSVRAFEPRLALVPGKHLPAAPNGLNPEDVFYGRLLDIATILQPKALLLEIGDYSQALRVVKFYRQHALASHTAIELWRDWPHDEPDFTEVGQNEDIIACLGASFEIKGSGNIRSILIRKTGLPQC